MRPRRPRDRPDPRPRGQACRRRRPLGIGAAGREQLLELVDGEQEACVARAACRVPRREDPSLPTRARGEAPPAAARRDAGAGAASLRCPAAPRRRGPGEDRHGEPTTCRCPTGRRCRGNRRRRGGRRARPRAARGRSSTRHRPARSSRGPCTGRSPRSRRGPGWPGPETRACSRTSWRSITLPASSASTSLSSLLPAAAREATSTSTRLASSVATASAACGESRQLG